jgi:hypothetical protein
MKSIETEITIKGSAEKVWSVLTDFAAYPKWNPFIPEASGEVAPGARLKVRIHPPHGSPMALRPTVRKASAGRELRWLGHLIMPGLFDGEHSFEIEPVSATEVRLRQKEQFRGVLVPLFTKSMYDKIRAGFDAMNRALKERVEGT